ncbi:hypothetical protein ACJMK2_044344 [Sinanodonta woodiana]|uniref:CARD domain-containing protein n=1 Tax=Sinanodonta woodiana TaxID=1069815 RepID=A0ABD3VZV1_SINWO
MTRENGLGIAKCLLDQTLLSQDTYDRMASTCCARRHSIDILLKKVINGSKEGIVTFFNSLKVECPLIARAVIDTTITHKDRSKFAQLARRRVTGGPIMRFGISERDVTFFKYHLCESEEVVEHIADVMLSRFHFSILDHSGIVECPTSRERISVLFQTMHLYKLCVVTEFHGVVKPKLYQQWMESRSTQGSRWSGLYRWIKKAKPAIDDSFKSEEIQLKKVEGDSFVLRFITGVNFSVDLLKPESLEMKIKTLLKRGCLESKTEPKRVAHITVYIDSPVNKVQSTFLQKVEGTFVYPNAHVLHGKLFIVIRKHPKTNNFGHGLNPYHNKSRTSQNDNLSQGKHHQAEMKNRNRDIMLEEMNPARLKKWMLEQPCIEIAHIDMLESKLSEQDLFRQEEMTLILDCINGLENGDKLLEKYSETNDLYVYNKVFRKHQESHSQQEEIPGHRAAVTYVKGGGLQELFSFSIIFNDEGLSKDQLTSCDEVLSSENN